MPRTSSITYDQVAAVIQGLLDRGQVPTTRLIREHLGGGSMKTILRHHQYWRANNITQRSVGQVLPESVQRCMLDYVEASVSEATSSLSTELTQQQHELEALAAENGRLEDEICEHKNTLESLKTGRDEASGQVVVLTADNTQLRSELQRTREMLDEARVELATWRVRAESAKNIENELAKCRQLNEQEHAARVSAEQAAAVAVALRQQILEQRKD